ncbi:MAG: GNAT family N-acetyltransferase [Ilumatobacteraceae bacterium]
MLPLRTPRLTVRQLGLGDVPIIANYRNDGDVAMYQDWTLPYSDHRLAAHVAGEADGGIDYAAGTNLGIEFDGTLIGDLYVRVDDGLADMGWTLRTGWQGRGLGREAVSAVVEQLFTAFGVHRIAAEMHVDNIASARLCEAVGMTFEARTRMNYPGRMGWEDNLYYAMLLAEWRQWVGRSRRRPDKVALVELGPSNVGRYAALRTHRSQERLVAPMPKSFRDALFPEVVGGSPVVPWMRGIEADGSPAGFVMLSEATAHHPEPYLWRLLIDRMEQRRGIGEVAVGQVIERLRAAGHASLMVSWVDGPGSPRRFYERLGFVPTGEIDHGEIVARLTW